MRTYIAALASLSFLSSVTASGAQERMHLIEPLSNTLRLFMKPSAQTRNGAIASNGSSLAKPGVSLLNQGALVVDVNRKVEAKTAAVEKLLDESGQPGVLMSVRVEKAITETDHWELYGDDVLLVGAGTSPVDVLLADGQRPTLKSDVRRGYRADKGSSYYMWFTREGGQTIGQVEPGELLDRRVAFMRGNQALDHFNAASRDRAVDAALSSMSVRLEDAKARASAASFKASQFQQAARFEKINSELASALQNAARANAAAATFDLVANAAQIGSSVMTIAAERGWLKNSIDDPEGKIDKAATRDELKSAAQGIAKDLNDRVDTLRGSQSELKNMLQKTRADIQQFMRSNSYPLNEVPQGSSSSSVLP